MCTEQPYGGKLATMRLNSGLRKLKLGCFCWIALRRCSSKRKAILPEYIQSNVSMCYKVLH